MSEPSNLVTVTQKRYRCRHVHAAGHQCGSPALRNEEFCYFHHTTRPRKAKPGKFRHLDAQEPFELPLVEDLPSALSVAAPLLCRVASNDLDPNRAGKLLYNLQIITSIIDKVSRAAAKAGAVARPEPLEELVTDAAHGLIAPITEYAGAPSVPASSGRVGSGQSGAQAGAPSVPASSGRVGSAPPPPERDYTPEEQDYFKKTVSVRGYEPFSEFIRPESISDEDIETRVTAHLRSLGRPPYTAIKDADGKLITIHELGARYTKPIIQLLREARSRRTATIPTLNAAAEHRPTRKTRSALRMERRKIRHAETFPLTCT